LSVPAWDGTIPAPWHWKWPISLIWINGLQVGRYAAWVDENYRVIFRFEAASAMEVDYVDYH
jgi:hypothetical protein